MTLRLLQLPGQLYGKPDIFIPIFNSLRKKASFLYFISQQTNEMRDLEQRREIRVAAVNTYLLKAKCRFA